MAYIEDGTSTRQGDFTTTYPGPNGDQTRLVWKLEAEGIWKLDGTTLREFMKKITIDPGDAPTRVFADNNPAAVADMRRQVEQSEPKSYGSVTFVSDDEVDLTDQETGWSLSMRRIREE